MSEEKAGGSLRVSAQASRRHSLFNLALACLLFPASAGPAPNCTGTYDKATGTVSQKACKTRNFKPAPTDGPEICFLGDSGIPHFP